MVREIINSRSPQVGKREGRCIYSGCLKFLGPFLSLLPFFSFSFLCPSLCFLFLVFPNLYFSYTYLFIFPFLLPFLFFLQLKIPTFQILLPPSILLALFSLLFSLFLPLFNTVNLSVERLNKFFHPCAASRNSYVKVT